MSKIARFFQFAKTIAIQIVIVFILLFVIEAISYSVLSKPERQFGFFVNAKTIPKNSFGHLSGYGYDLIDPLLGWGMSKEALQNMGYEVEHNCVVFRSKMKGASKPIKIFITGGSTADVGLNHENWPKYFHEMLEQTQINADVYVAAVGGYNSGQELLKTIRDGMEIEPDICISYSGANDLYHDYASYYEYDFFSSNVSKSKSSVLLPNTLFVIKKWLGIRSVNMMEEKEDTVDIKFWNRNMAMLNNLAVGRNAKFIGVLQPVLGVGKHKQDREMDIYAGNIAGYKTYYPALMERCIQHPNYLYDMSMVFDSINDKVFMDDCHLTNTFQPFIAKRIVHLLQEKGILR